MKQSEIWAVKHAFAWKDDPDRQYEGTVAVIESEDLAREWLRKEAAYAESRGWDVILHEPEGELHYETKNGINRFELILLPFHRKGGDD